MTGRLISRYLKGYTFVKHSFLNMEMDKKVINTSLFLKYILPLHLQEDHRPCCRESHFPFPPTIFNQCLQLGKI